MPKQGTVRTVLYSTVQYCTMLYSGYPYTDIRMWDPWIPCGGLWGLGAHAHPQGGCKRLRWLVEKKNLRSPCGRWVWQCDSQNLLHPWPVQALAVACAIRGGEGRWDGGAKG